MQLTLDALIKDVEAAGDEDLVQLEAAALRARELGDLGDALLNHFVDRSRRSGHTWATIGEHLGVTRQAAQKRFVDSAGASVTLERFTMRARAALDHAVEAAVALQHNYVGTEHQLLGLLDVDGGIAGDALSALGVSRDAIEAAVVEKVGRGDAPVTGRPPFTPRAAKVLEEAINASSDLSHNYVGTEHLLLALFRANDGLATTILEQHGVTRDAARDAVIDLLKGFTPPS